MQVSEAIGIEAEFFVIAVFYGMGLVFLYDVLRIIRRLIPHGNIWIGIEDICYWVFCTVAVFLLLYQKNDGMLRAFCFMGIAVGGGLYAFFLSRHILKICVTIFGAIFQFLGKVWKIISAPFIKTGKKMNVFIRKRLKKLCKAIKMGLCKR